MNKFIKIGCEIFIKKDDAILLGQRRNCYGEGDWALPGGHLEYGESLINGAKRELKEELGIDALDLDIITIAENIKSDNHYIHISFILRDYVGEIQCMEPNLCYEWKFFNISDLPQNIFEPHKKILETFFENVLYKT